MSGVFKASFKRGMIIMWSGTIATIPGGWVLCNGSNSTPDLRNRMIVCADADSGGVAKTTIAGAAVASGGAATHTIDITEIPAHTHSLAFDNGGSNSTTSALGRQDAPLGSGSTGSAGSGVAMSLLNPFYALAYIMKL